MGEHRPYKARVTGSSPVASTTSSPWLNSEIKKYGRLAQLGEHRPYKARVTGSSPVASTTSSPWLNSEIKKYGRLAQLGEHRPYKARVTGSSPVASTTSSPWLNSEIKKYGRLAQLGEHRPYKARVTGSSPVASTTSLTISISRNTTIQLCLNRCLVKAFGNYYAKATNHSQKLVLKFSYEKPSLCDSLHKELYLRSTYRDMVR